MRRILQRYVLREMIGPTLLGLAVFTFVLFATHLFRLTDLLVNRGVPLPIFLQFVGSLLPPLLVLTTPMAFLVGVLLGFGRLAADNEIAAIRTSGGHLLRVFYPVLLASALLTGCLWAINENWVPRLVNFNMTLLEKIQFIVAGRLEAGRVFNPKSDMDVALYFRHRNPLTQRMEGVTLKVVANDAERRSKTEVLAAAHSGRMEPNLSERSMDVLLTSGTLHHFDSTTSGSEIRYSVAKFKELRWQVRLKREKATKVGQLAKKPREMLSREIAYVLRHGSVGADDRGALSAEMVQRRSIPLACLAFALLGIPLAIRVRPTGKAVAFSIAFGLIFFYYIMLKWGVSLCQTGAAGGKWVIFLPNIVVGGLGLVLFYRMLRQ